MNVESSASIVDLVSRLWDCTAPHASYICNLEGDLDDLRLAIEELKESRNDVMARVNTAEEGQQKKRLDQVQGWLSRVEVMESEVDKLIIDGSQEIEKKCMGGCCPRNCKSRYKLGKKVAKKLKEVAVLKSKGDFPEVADKLPLASVSKRPSEPTVGLESTFDEVWSYIEDERVGIIGLFGLGGVGKTTLLTEINNKLSSTTLGVDVVIWVVVSQNPNLTKVQDNIGKRIGFQIQDDAWKSRSQDDKAEAIFNVLDKKKFVLLLDDLWERFDLSKVGVPLPDKQNTSKILFTTRSEDVCGQMEAHKKIKVKCLTAEEAWNLFQEKVGEDTMNAHLEIPKLAEIIAKECGGLPLVLITIGRTMAGKKTPHEWNHAVAILKKSTAEFSGMKTKVFALLKFSFESLSSESIRSCFLYCSLFPEDFPISKERLIENWYCEGFLDKFDDLNGAENQGHDFIGTLIRACLLEENANDIKMHDVIRDMALWIACERGKVKDKVLVQARDGLEKALDVGKWKGVERISLMHNCIGELTGTPSCPNLLTLFLNNNDLKKITPGFFQIMPNLRVLDLSWNDHLHELPVEICLLVSLRYLNLSNTSIKELPFDLRNLVELKYLGLGRINFEKIPGRLLSSFKKLQVLKIDGRFKKSQGLSKTLVEEVECLKDLNRLCVPIGTVSVLSRFLSSPKLPSCTTFLSLDYFEGSKYLNLSFLESMWRLSELSIFNCGDLEDMRVEKAGEGMANSEIIGHPSFHSLRFVWLSGCWKLKELTWLIFAPNLEDLRVNFCMGMEEVISCGKWGEATEEGGNLNPFAKLRTISLCGVLNLKSICPNALPFPCLKSIEVRLCPSLKKLPLNSDSAKGCGAVIRGEKNWWNVLKWEDEATRNAFLQLFQPYD